MNSTIAFSLPMRRRIVPQQQGHIPFPSKSKSLIKSNGLSSQLTGLSSYHTILSSFYSKKSNSFISNSLNTPISQNLVTSFRNLATKAHAIDVSKGDLIKIKGDSKIYQVMKSAHAAKQQRSAIVKMELKEFKKGTKVPVTLRPTDQVEVVEVEKRRVQFQEVTEDGKYKFLNSQDAEEIEYDVDFIGETEVAYLQPGMEVSVSYMDEEPSAFDMPAQVDCVVESIDSSRGDHTVKAKLSNGRTIQKVPAYIKVGDKISIKVEDESFVSRASE